MLRRQVSGRLPGISLVVGHSACADAGATDIASTPVLRCSATDPPTYGEAVGRHYGLVEWLRKWGARYSS